MPDTSIGRLVTSKDEAIEEIRVQVKNGVDCIKLALDGIQTRPNGELIAAFTQDETTTMVTEAHRLGRKVVAHARGKEAVLYAARAGVDLIFHATYLDDECIEALLRSGSALGPTMTFQRNIIDFTQPHEPAAQKGRPAQVEREYAIACENMQKARKAGVPMMTGTDTGFAVTPVRRMARAGAGDLRPRSGLHSCRGVALRHFCRRAVRQPWRQRWPAGAGRLRRFHCGRGLAAREHRDTARQDAHTPCAYRRQTHADPRARLRPAPGH